MVDRKNQNLRTGAGTYAATLVLQGTNANIQESKGTRIKYCIKCKLRYLCWKSASNNRKYCSKKCANISRVKKGYWKKCLTCGKDIYAERWQETSRKFC